LGICQPNGANVCWIDALDQYRDVTIAPSGFATAVASPNDVIWLSGAEVSVLVPEEVVVEAYNLGAIFSPGFHNFPATLNVEILAENSVEGSQLASGSASGSTTIVDPNGERDTGDESADPVELILTLTDTSWTAPPVTRDVVFTQGTVAATITLGAVNAGLSCQPGFADIPPTTCTPRDPTPFAITSVEAPPTNPIAGTDYVTVPVLGVKVIDVLANDFDVNENIDPGTVTINLSPSDGDAYVDPTTGAITYVSTSSTPGLDVLNYSVWDDTGLSSQGMGTSIFVTVTEPLMVPLLGPLSLPLLVLGLASGGAIALKRRRRRLDS
jgi:hypothetical protein